MKTIYFLSFLFAFNLSVSQTKKPILVDAKYAINSNNTWNLADAKVKKFIPFAKNKSLNIGYNRHTSVWCYFKIKNNDPKNFRKIWLCFDNNHLDSILFYSANSKIILGDRTTNPSPFIDSQAFEINLKPNEERVCYIKIIKEISFLQFAYHFSEEKTLVINSNIKIAVVSFILGIILILIIFNFVLFYIYKEKLYGFYIFYTSLSAFYIMISSNYAKNFLWTDFLYFSECRIYVSSLWFINLSYFAIYFLDFKKHFPLKHKIIITINRVNYSIIAISFICLLLNKLTFIKIFFTLGYINFLFIIMLVIWSTFQYLKIDKLKSIFIFLGFLPQFIWMSAVILRSFQLIPKSLPENWLILINCHEVLLFGFILNKNYIDTFIKNKKLIIKIKSDKQKSIQVITQVQIKERRIVSDIIHDNFGSKIAHIMQLIELNKTTFAYKNLEELAKDIREISHSILPKALDEGTLIGCLQNQIKILNSGLSNPKIEFFNYGFPEKTTEKWIFDLYLISLELINNGIKHGKATTILIEFFDYQNSYGFQFSDNGIGYKTDTFKKGFGLENIEKRILNYKGSFEINSVENEGTVVQINLPK